jgi:hypothetical protein
MANANPQVKGGGTGGGGGGFRPPSPQPYLPRRKRVLAVWEKPNEKKMITSAGPTQNQKGHKLPTPEITARSYIHIACNVIALLP